MKNKILIIGAGWFGLALSQSLISNKDNDIYLFGDLKKLTDLQNNQLTLNGITLKPITNIYDNYDLCFQNKYNIIIIAVPAKEFVNVINSINQYIKENVFIINTSKGMMDTDKYFIDYVTQKNKHFKYAYLVGPSFAVDLLNNDNSIINICINDYNDFLRLESITNNTNLIFKHNINIKPFEFISSYKNVLALCFGYINTAIKSKTIIYSLYSYAINELKNVVNTRFKDTSINYLDYCVLGDITMCCFSDNSRNYQYGKDFYNLDTTKLQQKNKNYTIEGVRTIQYLYDYLNQNNIDAVFVKFFYELFSNKLTINKNDFANEIFKLIKQNKNNL